MSVLEGPIVRAVGDAGVVVLDEEGRRGSADPNCYVLVSVFDRVAKQVLERRFQGFPLASGDRDGRAGIFRLRTPMEIGSSVTVRSRVVRFSLKQFQYPVAYNQRGRYDPLTRWSRTEVTNAGAPTGASTPATGPVANAYRAR